MRLLVKTRLERNPFKRALYGLLMPSPSKGFVLGALSMLFWVFGLRAYLEERPLLISLVIGVNISVFAMVWQAIYDHYWREME